MTTLEKFNAFHSANPIVFELFEQQALRAIKSGYTRIGSKAIIEYLRWELNFYTKEINDVEKFKINNNYTPYYSRLFVSKYPQYKNLFVFKAVKS